jgi:RNA polymerase sigma-70 factor (ECF subfamily)
MNKSGAGASNGRKKDASDVADEGELIIRARDGDEEAFGALVHMYYQRVYNIARGFVREPEEARDLAQQAWLKVWKKLDTFKGHSGFFTWLYRLVTFVCLDYLRKKKRLAETELKESLETHREAGAEPAPSATPNPVRALEAAEIRERFEQALDTLSPTQRTAIVLREVEGLSYEEIARAMRCSKGTVMSRIFYARRNLQRELEDLR